MNELDQHLIYPCFLHYIIKVNTVLMCSSKVLQLILRDCKQPIKSIIRKLTCCLYSNYLDLKVYFSSARSFEKVGPAKIILQNQGVSKTNFVLIFAYDEMENGLAIIF